MMESQIDKRLYKGMTVNLDNRLFEHNSGKNKSTKAFRPWKLVYFEKFETRFEARNREKYLKSGIGREFIKDILAS
ncbi:GIY-YIG nuclease family protein [Bacteroidota bacterium]